MPLERRYARTALPRALHPVKADQIGGAGMVVDLLHGGEILQFKADAQAAANGHVPGRGDDLHTDARPAASNFITCCRERKDAMPNVSCIGSFPPFLLIQYTARDAQV